MNKHIQDRVLYTHMGQTTVDDCPQATENKGWNHIDTRHAYSRTKTLRRLRPRHDRLGL